MVLYGQIMCSSGLFIGYTYKNILHSIYVELINKKTPWVLFYSHFMHSCKIWESLFHYGFVHVHRSQSIRYFNIISECHNSLVRIPSLRKPINSNIRKWVVMLNYLVLWLLCMWLATKGVRKQVLIQSFGWWTDQQTDKQIDRPTDRCSDRLIERNFIKNFGIPSYCNFYHHHCLETGFFFLIVCH